jgi:hypothetical protein
LADSSRRSDDLKPEPCGRKSAIAPPTGMANATITIVPATPGVSLTWDTTQFATDGSIKVAGGGGSAPTLGVSQTGSTLTFSWTGAFKLQSQTNSLGVGLSTNAGSWFDYPDASNPVNVDINPANPTVFFRLKNQWSDLEISHGRLVFQPAVSVANRN